MTWIYGDWLAPLPRAIYKAPASTSNTCSDPRYSTATCVANGGTLIKNAGVSYSCGRCHTTGWTSDAAIANSTNNPGYLAKEPEASFAGITWDRLTNAPADVVNLSGGVGGDTNKYSSWDQWGIQCTRCHGSAVNVPDGVSVPPFSAPTGMQTHTSNMTAAADNSGVCTKPDFTSEAVCTSNGGTWLTACNGASPSLCTMASTTSGACATNGGVWAVNAQAWCSNTSYSNSTDCTDNGFTWNNPGGICTRPDVTTSGSCTGGSGATALTWRANGSQQACQAAGLTWSFPSCTVPAICSKPGYADRTTCVAAGGNWTDTTSQYTCQETTDSLGHPGKYTGNNSNRGPIITALCMNCHRQEGAGLPYVYGTCSNPSYTDPGACANNGGTWTDEAAGRGVPLKVGPAHSTVAFVSHPHGNQFLNSPHGKFTGKFTEIATGKFNYAMTGQYKSYFQVDGEAANTGNGCTGCHNVHSSVVEAGHENRRPALTEECTECHSGPYAVDMTKINHLGGTGTPLEKMAVEPSEPCIICHMPGYKHLWRINTSAGYSTYPMPAALTTMVDANTAAEGTNTNAVWVDVDDACGQCHGGGTVHAETTGTVATGSAALTVANATGFAAGQRVKIAGAGSFEYDDLGAPVRGDFETFVLSVAGTTVTLAGNAPIGVTGAAVEQNPVKNGGNYRTKAVLAAAAEGMHATAGVSYAVTFSASQVPDTLTATATASVACGSDPCPSFQYVWSWGDGSPDTTTTDPVVTATHTYAAAGTQNITLTVMLNQPPPNFLAVGSSTQSLTLVQPITPLTAAATCTWDANTWIMQVVDASTGGSGTLRISVDWGDGSLRSFGAAGGTFNRTYISPGAFAVKVRATDSRPVSAEYTCATTATPAYFAITGTVKKADDTTPFSGVAVTLKKSGVPVKSVTTGTLGTYTLGSLKPGTYTVSFTRAGFTFPVLGPYTIGPSVNTANVKANLALGSTTTTPKTRLSTVD